MGRARVREVSEEIFRAERFSVCLIRGHCRHQEIEPPKRVAHNYKNRGFYSSASPPPAVSSTAARRASFVASNAKTNNVPVGLPSRER